MSFGPQWMGAKAHATFEDRLRLRDGFESYRKIDNYFPYRNTNT